MAKLESLIIDMQLESAQLRKGLDEIKKKLDETAKHAEGLLSFEVLKEVGHLAVEAGEKLAEFVHRGAEVADQMGKMAQTAGTSVESFSRLAYAAGLSKVSNEDLGVALKKLNGNISEAAAGSAKQASLFHALGISVKDAAGHVRSADEVMGDVAEKFAGMQDGAAKSAFAVELLGKAGAQMIPFLNEGREGIKKLGDEAARLGLTISGETARAATEFNDNLERMKRAVDGVAVRVAADLSPGLAALTKQMTESKAAGEGFADTATVIADGLRVVASVAVFVWQGIRTVAAQLAGLASVAANVVSGDLDGAAEAFSAGLEEINHINEEAEKQYEAIWKKAEKVMTLPELDLRKSGDNAYKGFKLGEKGAQEQEQAIKELEKTLLEYRTKLADFTGAGEAAATDLEKLQASLEVGELGEKLKKAGVQGKELANSILAVATALDELAKKKVLDELAADLGRGYASSERDAANLKFKARRDNIAAGHDIEQRGTAYGNVSKSNDALIQQNLGGFSSFDEALSRLAEQTKAHNQTLLEAGLAEKNGATEHAHNLQLLADEEGRGIDKTKVALEQFQSMAVEAANRLRERLEHIAQGLAAVGLQFISKLGELGDVVNAGIQGFQSGGVWGAILAVIVELLSKFEGFSRIMDIANGLVQGALGDLAGSLGRLIEGIRPLLGAFGMLFGSIHGMLGPIIDLIGGVLGQLSPLFVILSIVLKPLGSLFASIAGVLGQVLGPILVLIANIFRGVGIVMGGLQTAVSAVWLALVTAGDEILKAFGNHSLQKARDDANAALKGNIQSVQDLVNMDVGKLMSQANDAADHFEDLGKKTDDMGKSAGKTSKALDRLTAQFTNVPSGFRLNYRTFEVTTPTAQAGGGAIQQIINVHGNLVHERDLAKAVGNSSSKMEFQRSGKWP